MNYKKAYELLKEFLLNLNADCETCKDCEECERDIDCFEYGPYWEINPKFIEEIEKESKKNEK